MDAMHGPSTSTTEPNDLAAMPGPNRQGLLKAMRTATGDGALAAPLSEAQWQALASLLVPRRLAAGQRLMSRGDGGDSAFLLESGGLQVFVDGNGSRHSHRIALLKPGAVVGEPALFGGDARMATVEATHDSVVWALSVDALGRLKARDPALVADLLRAMGAVMARRMRANLEQGLPVA